MSKFNIEEYETVQDRLNTFHKLHPEGSIITEDCSWKETSDGRIIWTARVIVRKEADGPVCGTGTASEIEGANKFAPTNACELAETSARGRALVAIGIGQQASRDEVASARSKEAAPKRVSEEDPWTKGMEILGDALAAQPIPPSDTKYNCTHGVMVYKTGISKKTNKPWAGYFCPDSVQLCDTKWQKVG
jgi:hypothetical protein